MSIWSDWSEVVNAVESERQYQDLLAPHQVETPLSIGEEIALLHKYLAQTLENWSEDFNYPELLALEGMRKIAGIAMRCMENHGAIPRNSMSMHAAEIKNRQDGRQLGHARDMGTSYVEERIPKPRLALKNREPVLTRQVQVPERRHTGARDPRELDVVEAEGDCAGYMPEPVDPGDINKGEELLGS